ncbi:MAG: hypothetical protein DWQ01_20475 [Planctomycetota bacterium]|nr:MAG: hypothetical protein DWQ01_20475 [Planctomycetota bacterium]
MKRSIPSRSFFGTIHLGVWCCCWLWVGASSGFSQDCGSPGYVKEFQRFDGQDYQRLGHSVSGAGDVDGDGVDDFILGAPYSSPNGISAAGSVFVYSGATGILLFQFDGQNQNDRFGDSVAGPGDTDGDGLADILVGAYGFLGSRLQMAFLYSGADGSLLHQFSGPNSMAWFVAGAGDADGDGLGDLLIGAPSAAGGAGSVYLYSGASGSLIHQIDGSVLGGEFGASGSSAGDVDQDGHDDFLVGAPGHHPGFAFVYSGASGNLLFQIDGPDHYYDNFGDQVAAAQDVNQDGYPDFFIGSYITSHPNGAFEAGAAYVHSGFDGSLLFQFDGAHQGAAFGYSLAGPGDMTGDGFPDLVVGSPWTSRGSAFIYCGATGELLKVLEGPSSGSDFGTSCAAIGDVDGNGTPDFVVGAPLADLSGQGFDGSAYAYSFHRHLQLDQDSISAGMGGQISFGLDFPETEAGVSYRLLGSLSGTGPWNVQGGCIPLTFDWFSLDMLISPPAIFYDTMGTLDLQGNAVAGLVAPAGSLAAYEGQRAWFSAIAFHPLTGLHYASQAKTVDVLP